jgi:hypothetical protein
MKQRTEQAEMKEPNRSLKNANFFWKSINNQMKHVFFLRIIIKNNAIEVGNHRR